MNENPALEIAVQPTGMEMGLFAISGLLGLIAFICWIMIVIKMFQNNQTGLGIGTIVGVFVCGIGYLIALIFGWMKAKEWNISKLMMIYIGSLIGSLIFCGAGYIPFMMRFAKEVQNMQPM